LIPSAHEEIAAALREYADRGVFRGFRETAARGRVDYHFTWLTRRLMHARSDPAHGSLAFPALLPHVAESPALVRELKAIVAERSTRSVPDHKRIDARRARLSASISKGDFSLAVAIRGANHEYAVKRSLNLINDLFVMLRERHPEYLIEHFGMSSE
jgi:hypothetical protein